MIREATLAFLSEKTEGQIQLFSLNLWEHSGERK